MAVESGAGYLEAQPRRRAPQLRTCTLSGCCTLDRG